MNYLGFKYKILPSLKKENPWLSKVNSQTLQVVLKDLDTAYKNFFEKTQ